MDNFIVYILKSCVGMLSLYLVYLIFLRNETFFSMNRFYLLGILLVSLLLPFIHLPIDNSVSLRSDFTYIFENISVFSDSIRNNQIESVSLISLLLFIYLIISSILLIRFSIRLLQIYLICKKSIVQKHEGINIIWTDYDLLPFSFLRTIFINPSKLSDEDKNRIIIHEKIHIQNLHSIDMIIIEIFIVFMWFNPIIWLIKSSMKAIHEYMADSLTIIQTKNKIEYQKLLLKEAFGGYQFDFTNNFNFSLIKRRINMMTQKKSDRFASLKIMFAIPVSVLILFTYTFTDGNNQSIAGELKNDPKVNEEKMVNVDEMPAFDQNELIKAIKFPEEARKSGKSGKVICRVLVSKAGLPSKIEIAESKFKIFEKPAIEAIQKIKFKPAKFKGETVETWVTIPISFKLK